MRVRHTSTGRPRETAEPDDDEDEDERLGAIERENVSFPMFFKLFSLFLGET